MQTEHSTEQQTNPFSQSGGALDNNGLPGLIDMPQMRLAFDMRRVRPSVRMGVFWLLLTLLPRVLFGLPIHARARLRYSSELDDTIGNVLHQQNEALAKVAAAGRLDSDAWPDALEEVAAVARAGAEQIETALAAEQARASKSPANPFETDRKEDFYP